MCQCTSECDCQITGTQGDSGDPATIEIGTVTTGAAGSSAEVSNVGTPTNAIFNFSIPQGSQGIAGETSHGVINATSSQALTQTQSGSIVYFNNTELVAITLPVNPAIGTYYIFRVSQTPGANYTLTATSAKYLGYLFAKKSATADSQFTPNLTTNNIITLNGTTQGGIIGTDFMVAYVGTGRWDVSGWTYGSGVLATSFSG